MESRISTIEYNINHCYFFNAFHDLAMAVADKMIEKMTAAGKDELIFKYPFNYTYINCFDKFTGEEEPYYIVRVRKGKDDKEGAPVLTMVKQFALDDLFTDKGDFTITEADIDKFLEDRMAFETILYDNHVFHLGDTPKMFNFVISELARNAK